MNRRSFLALVGAGLVAAGMRLGLSATPQGVVSVPEHYIPLELRVMPSSKRHYETAQALERVLNERMPIYYDPLRLAVVDARGTAVATGPHWRPEIETLASVVRSEGFDDPPKWPTRQVAPA